MKRNVALTLLALLTAACTGSGLERGTVPPSPGVSSPAGATPSPSAPGHALPLPELKLRILSAVGDRLDWCDPDIFPVGDTKAIHDAAYRVFSRIRHQLLYRLILRHAHIAASGQLGTEQVLAIYEIYKDVTNVLAIPVRRHGDLYRFVLYRVPLNSGYDQRVVGVVDLSGRVSIEARTTSPGPMCPICLAKRTLIATPSGPIPVERVRVGILVWSVDRAGNRIPAVVHRIRRRAVEGELLRIRLTDDRSVLVSAAHPLPHGGVVGQLEVGDRLNGSRLAGITLIAYRGFTYDLLPSGPTGDYFADGILLGSTLGYGRSARTG